MNLNAANSACLCIKQIALNVFVCASTMVTHHHWQIVPNRHNEINVNVLTLCVSATIFHSSHWQWPVGNGTEFPYKHATIEPHMDDVRYPRTKLNTYTLVCQLEHVLREFACETQTMHKIHQTQFCSPRDAPYLQFFIFKYLTWLISLFSLSFTVNSTTFKWKNMPVKRSPKALKVPMIFMWAVIVKFIVSWTYITIAIIILR